MITCQMSNVLHSQLSVSAQDMITDNCLGCCYGHFFLFPSCLALVEARNWLAMKMFHTLGCHQL